MTQAQIVKLAKIWKKRLRLQDQDIALKFVQPGELSNPEALGMCGNDKYKKKSEITILEPKYWGKTALDIELVLVHEMLHVKLDYHELRIPEDQEHPTNIYYEKLVHQMAEILIAGYNDE